MTNTLSSSPGMVLRKRMKEQGMAQVDFAEKIEKSQGWISNYLFRNTEETVKRMLIKEPDELEHMARVLNWSTASLLSAIGLEVPGLKIDTNVEVATSSRTIPTYSLTISSNRGELMQNDVQTVIPEAWAGEFKALRIHNRTLIYLVCDSPKEGDVVVLESGGIVIGRAVSIKGNVFFIELDHAFSERTAVVENPNVLGVVKEERISY